MEVKKLAYYPGCFANFWWPEVGKSVVRFLENNSFQVTVTKHRCCGIARIGYGDLKGARIAAIKLIDELYPLVQRGFDIVTSCPSCSLAIKEDFPFLIDTEKTKLVAQNTYYLSHYLMKQWQQKFNQRFHETSLTVFYHVPCHLKAQGITDASIKLMSLIPGLKVIDLDRGCCGISGTFGFKHKNMESSMAIGKALFDRIKEVNTKIVITDCGGCRLQIEQGTNVKVIHPIILLNEAMIT